MPSYTVAFAFKIMTNAAKERQALGACLDYLSAKQRKTIILIAKAHHTPKEIYRQAELCCMISGIRGYWATRALARFMIQQRFPGTFLLKD